MKVVPAHTTPLPDEELLQAYKNNGDQETLATLYLRYSTLVYGVCLKYFKDTETARDAVMNIYEELVRKAMKHDIQHFKSWLYTLTKNHCLMQLRKKNPVRNMDFDEGFMQSEPFLHQEENGEREETFNRLAACMETLPPVQKQSIVLFYTEKKCYNEIAATTGLAWDKVRSAIQNGRRNLKICMEKNGL